MKKGKEKKDENNIKTGEKALKMHLFGLESQKKSRGGLPTAPLGVRGKK